MIPFDIETTGLNPLRNKIVTIQVKQNDEIRIWKLWEENDEVTIIEKFLEFLRNADEPIVGYNIKGFDLPFIKTKLLLKDKMDHDILELFRNKKFIDIIEYQNKTHGMNNWLEELGIQRKNGINGWHIPTLYDLKDFEKIEKHAVEDLFAIEEIVKKLQIKI